jgi:hypothetical protein
MASSKPQSQLGQVLINFSINGAFPEEEAVSAAYAEPSALPAALVAVRDAKVALEVGFNVPFVLRRLPSRLSPQFPPPTRILNYQCFWSPPVFRFLSDKAFFHAQLNQTSACDVQSADNYIQVEIRQISKDKASSVDTWISHSKTIQGDIERSRKLANTIVREAEAEEERLEALKDKESTVEFLAKEVAFSTSLKGGLKAIQISRDRLRDVEELASERKIHEALIALEGIISIAPPYPEHHHSSNFQPQ